MSCGPSSLFFALMLQADGQILLPIPAAISDTHLQVCRPLWQCSVRVIAWFAPLNVLLMPCKYPLQQPSSPSTTTQYKELRALALNLFLFWKNSIGSLVSLRKFYALPADRSSGCLLTHWVVVPRQGHHHWDATAKAQAWTPLFSVSYSCHKPHQAAHSCRA